MEEKRFFSRKNIGFWVIFIVAFSGSLYLLSLINLAPGGVVEYMGAVGLYSDGENFAALSSQTVGEDASNMADTPVPSARKPERIVIEKIGVDASVLNPRTAGNNVLNEQLKRGVVRYPGSGSLGDKRNMLLMGHASTLPAVENEMYKVFSKIRELDLGDKFKIYSSNRVYFYKIKEMSLTHKNEAKIDFNTGEREVTLSTCNTLGEKSERFVVRADFVESFPLD